MMLLIAACVSWPMSPVGKTLTSTISFTDAQAPGKGRWFHCRRADRLYRSDRLRVTLDRGGLRVATTTARPPLAKPDRARVQTEELELKARVSEILNRHPAVGMAVGVVRNGRLDFFYPHGVADIASITPITEDTVFRIA